MAKRDFFATKTTVTIDNNSAMLERDAAHCPPTHSKNLDSSMGQASWIPWTWFIGTIVLASSVLFYRLAARPIVLWDEARIAINALEMAHAGLSLITTYGGMPDHWNTKPPLLIWLMSISIRALGINEWAVRLPSALSALATVVMVFAFCHVRLKRPFVGFSAILVLFASGTFAKGYISCLGNDYVQMHAARNGDYDVPLALWTTGYLLAAYMYMHAAPSIQRRWLVLCTIGIALAFMTKTVQGLIFLPALLIYAISQGRMVQILRSPTAYAGCAALLILWAGYYFVREQIDPGYFASAIGSDVVDRFFVDSTGKGPFFYVGFFHCVALLFAGLQFFWGRGESRQISLFLTLASLFYLVIISMSVTKHHWYAVPLCPLIAMIIAIGLDDVVERIKTRGHWLETMVNRMLAPISLLVGMAVIALNVQAHSNIETWMISDDRNLTNVFLRGPVVQHKSPQKFVVFQQNFVPGGVPGDLYYVAPTLFYVTALRASGHQIEILPPSAVVPQGFDAAVICGATMRNAVAAQFVLRTIAEDGKCGIYRLAAK